MASFFVVSIKTMAPLKNPVDKLDNHMNGKSRRILARMDLFQGDCKRLDMCVDVVNCVVSPIRKFKIVINNSDI